MNVLMPEWAQIAPMEVPAELVSMAQPSMVDAAVFNAVVNLGYKLVALLLLCLFLKLINRINTGGWNSFNKIKENALALSINRAAWVVAGGLVLAFS